MWTDEGAAGWEAAEDKRQHNNKRPYDGNVSIVPELLDALQAKIAPGLLTARVKRGTTRAQPEMTVQQELEVPADGRRWRDERQCNNQLDKRHERGAVRGGGAMRGGGAGKQEATA
jgi:hypothetical protein